MLGIRRSWKKFRARNGQTSISRERKRLNEEVAKWGDTKSTPKSKIAKRLMRGTSFSSISQKRNVRFPEALLKVQSWKTPFLLNRGVLFITLSVLFVLPKYSNSHAAPCFCINSADRLVADCDWRFRAQRKQQDCLAPCRQFFWCDQVTLLPKEDLIHFPNLTWQEARLGPVISVGNLLTVYQITC